MVVNRRCFQYRVVLGPIQFNININDLGIGRCILFTDDIILLTRDGQTQSEKVQEKRKFGFPLINRWKNSEPLKLFGNKLNTNLN